MYKRIIRLLNASKFEYIFLFLILTAGLLIRLYKINTPLADWHSWRQADTASVTRIYIDEGVNMLLPRFYDISSIQSRIFNPNGYRMVEFPVYNLITTVFFNTFGNFNVEVWSRLTTIFAALTTSYFLYLIGRRFLGKWGGLLSAFFYLFIPFNIYFTRVILPDPLGVTFGVVALWLFIKFFDSDRYSYLYISAVFFSLMLLIKPYLGFYLIPAAYLINEKFGLKKVIKKPFITKVIIFFSIAFIPFIAWRIWEGLHPEGIPLFWWAFNGNGIRFRPAYWNWVFGERLGHLILGSLGVVPFMFGVLSKKNNSEGGDFIRWFLGGALFYVILVASANVMHDYYQIITIPAISLGLAAGTVYLWEQSIFNKILARIVLVVSIGVMLITGWYQIKGNYIINHYEIIEAGEAVDRITPKDAIVVAPYNGDTAFLYQTKRC
jgi:4-amino-4-deoxy-L-arabinose transferase-like glycosyltransferase